MHDRWGTCLEGPKDLCCYSLEVLLTAQNLLQRHKHCCGLNSSVHFGNGVVRQLFASKCQPGTCDNMRLLEVQPGVKTVLYCGARAMSGLALSFMFGIVL